MMSLGYAAPLAATLLLASPVLAQDLCSHAGKFPPGCPRVQAVAPAEPVSPPIPGDEGVMTPDQLLSLFRDAFRQHGCVLPMADAQMAFARTLSGMIGVPAETLRDPQSPWYRAIGDSLNQARSAGTIIADSAAGQIRYPGCDQ